MNWSRLWHRYLPVGLVFCIGVALSFLAFNKISSWEKMRLQTQFTLLARDRATELRERLQDELEVLHSMGDLYATDTQVSRWEFQMFVQRALAHRLGIQALAWIPRVADAQRIPYEETAQRNGYGNFQITERLPQGYLVRAATRPEYFPVYYVEPFQGNEGVLGFDLGSDTIAQVALEKARDTAALVASEKTTLVQEVGQQSAFLGVLPIYAADAPHATLEARREHLKGFILGVFGIGDIVRAALEDFDMRGMMLWLSDTTEAASEPLLFLHGASGQSTATFPGQEQEAALRHGIHWRRTFDVAGRQWTFLCVPTPNAFPAQTFWWSSTVLIGGLLLTILLCSYLVTTSRRTSQIEDLAEERTVALVKTTQELEAQKIRLRAIVDNIVDGVVTLDEHGAITFFNSAAERMFGYNAEEVLAQNVKMLMPEPYHSAHDDYLRAYCSPGIAKVVGIRREVVGQRKDGSCFPLDLDVRAMPLGDQRFFTGIVRDITERKVVEAVLVEQTHISQLTAEVSTVLLHSTSLQMLLQQCTAALVQHLNVAFGRIWTLNESKQVLELQTSAGMYTHLHGPHSRVPVGKYRIGLIAQECKPYMTNAVIGDPRVSDQEWTQGESMVAFAGYPLHVDDRVLGVVALFARHPLSAATCEALETVAKMITLGMAHYQTEGALQNSQERYELAIHASSHGIWDWDIDTNNVYYSPQFPALLGYEADEFAPDLESFTSRLHPQDHGAMYDAVQKHLKYHAPYDMEYRLCTKQGEYRWFRIRGQATWNAVGIATRMTGSITDITKRRNAEDALANAAEELKQQNWALSEARDAALQATRAKSEFLASMSHEIRTPMNAILGMADLLSETPLTPEQHDYVQRFKKAGEHLLTLINDILDLSKIEAGHLELDQRAFDLDELINSVVELMAMRTHAKGLELCCTIAPDIPASLVGDPQRLRQILVNLLSNAIKFTNKGEVVLRVINDPKTCTPGTLHFSVSDTGIGIPADRLGAIFESFTQVDASTTRQYGGTGLGLSISQRLVQLMHGRMWVESQLGCGSTFYFSAQLKVNPAPLKQRTVLPSYLQGLRVLVVDDNATNRFILRETLGHWGALVTEAGGAEEGLIAWIIAEQEHRPFQFALVDSQMPDKDGFYFVEQLQHTQSIDTAIVCMLTSDTHPGDHARCQTLGIAQYLLKPITRTVLFSTIVEAMSRRADEPQPQPQGVQSAALQDDKTLHILVAEDNEDNQMVIKFYLQKTPYKITIAENGAIAVERFTTGSYDLVLMDVQMPIMDGYDATLCIRQWEYEHNRLPTPIIALTAHAMTEDIQKSLAVGCNGHLTKPLTQATLLATIAAYIGSETPSWAGACYDAR